jgi:hypothetical protein
MGIDQCLLNFLCVSFRHVHNCEECSIQEKRQQGPCQVVITVEGAENFAFVGSWEELVAGPQRGGGQRRIVYDRNLNSNDKNVPTSGALVVSGTPLQGKIRHITFPEHLWGLDRVQQQPSESSDKKFNNLKSGLITSKLGSIQSNHFAIFIN